MTMITPSYLGETIEYSSLHACRSTLEDPTSILLRLSGAGRVEAGASRRTGGASTWFRCWPRYRMNSSSFRRGSSTYFESSTMTVPHVQMLH